MWGIAVFQLLPMMLGFASIALCAMGLPGIVVGAFAVVTGCVWVLRNKTAYVLRRIGRAGVALGGCGMVCGMIFTLASNRDKAEVDSAQHGTLEEWAKQEIRAAFARHGVFVGDEWHSLYGGQDGSGESILLQSKGHFGVIPTSIHDVQIKSEDIALSGTDQEQGIARLLRLTAMGRSYCLGDRTVAENWNAGPGPVIITLFAREDREGRWLGKFSFSGPRWLADPANALDADLNDFAPPNTAAPRAHFAVVRALHSMRDFETESAAWSKPIAIIHNEVADHLSAIEIEDCPHDFQAVFRQYVRAWREGDPANITVSLQLVTWSARQRHIATR